MLLFRVLNVFPQINAVIYTHTHKQTFKCKKSFVCKTLVWPSWDSSYFEILLTLEFFYLLLWIFLCFIIFSYKNGCPSCLWLLMVFTIDAIKNLTMQIRSGWMSWPLYLWVWLMLCGVIPLFSQKEKKEVLYHQQYSLI